MTTRSTRFPLARGGALGALALAAILVACESKLPTAAEVEKMDVADVEQRVVFDNVSGTQYYVDGVETTPEMARNLSPEEIESVRVMKATMKSEADASTAPSRIDIVTKKAAQAGMLPSKVAASDEARASWTAHGDRMMTILDSTQGFVAKGPLILTRDSTAATGMRTVATDAPLFLIDGKIVEARSFHELSPKAIESVEVIKGEASTRLYGAEGKNGVVKITTKKQ